MTTIKQDGNVYCRTAPHTFGYGQFYGVVERECSLPRFALAFITANSDSIRGIKHKHESAHLIFVLEGQYVSSASNHENSVPAGSLIFVPAGTTHRDHFQTTASRTLTISISATQLAQVTEYVRLPESQSSYHDAQVTFITNRLAIECRCWRPSSSLTAEGLCLELLAAIADRDQTHQIKPPRWLTVARELIHDRCMESLTISEIARAVDVHPIHLTRTFRKFFNCTPGDYLRSCRLQIAMSLLRSSRSPVAQIASQAGFSDQSHLSKVFKRKLGVTPSIFRNTQ